MRDRRACLRTSSTRSSPNSNTTHQRKHLWLPGREQMNRMMVAVGGVAAVAVLAAVGLYFVGHGGGGIGGQATPAPTLTTTATPTLSATPPGTPTLRPPAALPASGAVAPGRYFADSSGYRYTFTVTGNGWTAGVNPPDVVLEKGSERSPTLPPFGCGEQPTRRSSSGERLAVDRHLIHTWAIS